MRPDRPKPRTTQTLRGTLAYTRPVHECPACRASRAPLDEELGLAPHETMTRRVIKKVADETAQTSYGQASANLQHQAALAVSPAECARLARQHGARLGQLQAQREQRWAAPGDEGVPAAAAELQARRLVVEADATTVLTVKGEEHKMVWCATGFALEDRLQKAGSARPLIAARRYAASGGSFEQFTPGLKALANRLGARRAEAAAFIADGAVCLWRWAEANMPTGTVLIQDYWHVCEHLHGLARELWGEAGAVRAQNWAALLRASRLAEVRAQLEAQHKRRRGALRKRIEEELHYLEAGQGRMDYARYEAAGWPIGSGAVEGTCKHLVKSRFGRTGARWRRANIEPVLALRLSLFNEEWEQDWQQRQLQPT